MKKKHLVSILCCVMLIMAMCFVLVGCGSKCQKMRDEINKAQEHQYETDTPPALCTKEGIVEKYGEPQYKIEKVEIGGVVSVPESWIWFEGCSTIKEAEEKAKAGEEVPFCQVQFGDDDLVWGVFNGWDPKDIKIGKM